MSKMLKLAVCIAPAVILLLLSGCKSGEGPAEFLFREADVDGVQIQIVYSVQDTAVPVGESSAGVYAVVTGTVSESCATVDEVRQEFDRSTNTFILTLTTRRPVEEACDQTISPFETTVPLGVENFPSGVYTVLVNGLAASFELEYPISPMR